MEVEIEIEHICPKCKYTWKTVEIIYIPPPEFEGEPD